MSGKNEHVRSFIGYYSKLKIAPEYAVLIKGPWGCGKSYLVQQCMEELEADDNPVNFLYVSLYGITSVEAIEERFFQILNPVLSSKGMVLAGRFAKGLLKGALKIDLDDDGKPDASMTIGTPDINLSDYMTDTRNYVLVFDDLERCSMEVNSVLGYINYFVEKDGYKVILIADEEKLIALSSEASDKPQFKVVKEKLIGKSLSVEADIAHVFDTLLDNLVEDTQLKDILKAEKEQLLFCFDRSSYSNLRSLRKTLLEFDRLWSVLDKEVKEKSELISHFLELFFILSMEVYSGAILPSEIMELIGNSAISRAFKQTRGQDTAPDKFECISGKYDFDFHEALISTKEWGEFFDRGLIDSASINASLKMTRYFSDENTPDWIKLWRTYDLEDDEFDQLYSSVRNSFDKLEYVVLGEIKHVSGLWLRFSREGLIAKTVEESLIEIKEYIDQSFSSDTVNVEEDSLALINSHCSYASLGYSDADSVEFKEISEYLNDKIKDKQDKELVEKSDELVRVIRSDPKKLYTLLCHSNFKQSPFYSRPILKHIHPDYFVTLMLEIRNSSKRTVVDAIFHRYEHQCFREPLISELPWLEEVIFKLQEAINNIDRVTPASIALKDVKSRLESALGNLRKSETAVLPNEGVG